MIRCGDLSFGVFESSVWKPGQRHLHIRLTGCKPEVAEKHILKSDGVGCLHLKSEWTTGRLGRKIDAPAASGVGRCAGGRSVERYRDLLARVGIAPNVDRHIALQHHVAGEDLR